MFQNLYEIIERDNNRFVVKLDKENTIFKVHFEGSPVLPGACMVEISKELIELIFNKKTRIERIKNIKFTKAVTPLENEIIVFEIETKTCDDGRLVAGIQVKGTNEEDVFSKIDLVINFI